MRGPDPKGIYSTPVAGGKAVLGDQSKLLCVD